jgi:two-component system KDP operon response regulator KdpE
MCERQRATASIRVLLVDDDAATGRLIRRVLVANNFEVAEADSTRGVQRLAQDPGRVPDVVVMELWAARTWVHDVIRYIRRYEHFRAVPILVISGRVSDEERSEAMRSGADELMAKPFGPMELVDRVTNLAMHGRRTHHLGMSHEGLA